MHEQNFSSQEINEGPPNHEISKNGYSATISCQGAVVLEFSHNKKPIFMPHDPQMVYSKQGSDGASEITTKERGGSFFCASFGPDLREDVEPSDKYDQHGFLRKIIWETVFVSSGMIVMRTPSKERWPEDLKRRYPSLSAEARFEMIDDGLAMSFTLFNETEEDVLVLGAIHPYFHKDKEDIVWAEGRPREPAFQETVEGLDFNLGKFIASGKTSEAARVINPDQNNYFISILSNEDDEVAPLQVTTNRNLPTTAIWSDNIDKFICFEPTETGQLFGDGRNPKYLAPGESRQYQMIVGYYDPL